MWSKIKNVSKATSRPKKPGKKKQDEKKGEHDKKEEVPEVDPKESFRQFVFDTIKTVFELVTVNDDIHINVDNVFPLMKTIEIDGNDETILDMVRNACIETYGNMDTHEFDEAVLDQRRRVTGEEWEEDIKSAFHLIDADEDGVITSQDVYQLMMGIGEMLTDDELNDIIKAADMDNDGQVNYKDFKLFLVGEVDESEEEPEEEEEENKEGEEAEKVEEPQETAPETTETKEENTEEVKEEVIPETEEEKQKREAEEKAKQEERMKKRKSLLWGYTKKPVEPPKPVTPEVPKETKTKHDSGIGSESESASVSEIDEDKTQNEERTEGIISVTVKHLDSISEEKDKEEVFEKSEPETEKTETRRTPSRLGSARSRRPLSAVTVASSTADSVIDTDEASEIDDFVTDDLRPARTSSARSRVMSARSRLSSRISSARSTASAMNQSGEGDLDITTDTQISKITGEISQITPDVSTVVEESESSESDMDVCLPENDGDAFTGPLSDRQITYVDNFSQTYGYCEVEPKPLFSKVPFVPFKESRNFPTRDSRFSQLQRAKSASKIHTIKKLESTILKRQNTEPHINLDLIRKANEVNRRDPRRPGVNGLVCRHITINLNLDSDPTSKFTSFSRELTKRPKTATTYSERRKQIAKEREKLKEIVDLSDDADDEEEDDPLISIVDLSKSLNKATGYPESPNLPLQHHGYKSVWPLARVKSARNDKINKGKNIELNSISRRLERQELPWRKANRPQAWSKSYADHEDSKKAQSVVNLKLPFDNKKEPKYKRTSPLSGLISYGQVRG